MKADCGKTIEPNSTGKRSHRDQNLVLSKPVIRILNISDYVSNVLICVIVKRRREFWLTLPPRANLPLLHLSHQRNVRSVLHLIQLLRQVRRSTNWWHSAWTQAWRCFSDWTFWSAHRGSGVQQMPSYWSITSNGRNTKWIFSWETGRFFAWRLFPTWSWYWTLVDYQAWDKIPMNIYQPLMNLEKIIQFQRQEQVQLIYYGADVKISGMRVVQYLPEFLYFDRPKIDFRFPGFYPLRLAYNSELRRIR